MKRFFTSSAILKLFFCVLFLGVYLASKAVHTPMTFQANYSYNNDVIVDGPAPFPPVVGWHYTLGRVDTPFSAGANGRFGLVADNFAVYGLDAAGGNLTSVNAFYNFPVYTLAASNVDNALHLRNSNFDTLIFNNQNTIGDVYLLGAAGGENTTLSNGMATVTILFTDGSIQTSSNITFPHYRDSASSLPFAIAGIGRYSFFSTTGNPDADNGRPRLFDIRVALQYANYGKRIKGIRVQKTGGDQINVLGVCVDDNPCLPTVQVLAPSTPPTPAINITQAHNIKWRSVAGSQGFEIRLEAFPALTGAPNPMPLFPGPTAVNPTAPNNPGPNDTSISLGVTTPALEPNMVYVFYVRSKCTGGGTSVWNSVYFKTPDCASVNGISYEVSAAVSRTTRSLRLKWNRSTVFTGPSPTHIKFEYALTQDAVNAPTSGTQFTTDTSFYFQNLLTCRQYTLWVRNNCVANSWGPWTKQSFTTLCCPSAGTPDEVPGTNVPGAITLFWPGTKDSALTTYQYQLVLNAPGTVNHNDWINTNDTFVVFPNTHYPVINPGQQYKFFVRSYCSDTASAATPPSKIFINPFYACDTPTLSPPVVTNINMHGAQIDWTRGSSPAPYPIIQYNVAITTSATPPSNRYTGVQIPPSNTHYFLTTDTFFHPTTLSRNTLYYVHVRTECDTVRRNLTQTTPTITYNWSPWVTTSFTTPDTCTPPIIPSITNITDHSIHAEWNLYYGIQGYEYYIDQQPADPTSPPASWPLISYNMVDPINLFSNTTYWFHLRTKCNATDYSPWTNTPFTTLALCTGATPAPALQPSGGTPNPSATSAIFNWPAIPNADAYDCAVTTTPTPPATPDATVSITTYTAQGLTPNTVYFFHLKANCSPNDVTSWSTIQFKTDWATNVTDLRNGVSVLVYPNPTNDDVTVDIQDNPKGTIQVLDMTGKVIYSTETAEKKTVINMKPYASGVYMIKYFVDPANTQVIRIQKL